MSTDKVRLLSQKETPLLLSTTVNLQRSIEEFKKTKYPNLSEVNDLKIQQSLIMYDLIFALMGIEGNYIRFSKQYKPQSGNEKVLQSLSGIDFKIAKNLDPSLKHLLKPMILSGKHYSSLDEFRKYLNQFKFGKICQSLSEFIRDFLSNEYLTNLDSVYDKYKSLPNYNILMMVNDFKRDNLDEKLKVLFEICKNIHENSVERKENSQKSNFLTQLLSNSNKDDVINDEDLDLKVDNTRFDICKGGIVLEIINNKIVENSGNLELLKFLKTIYSQVSQSYLQMLNDWLVKGEINDPYNEFLIKSNNLNTNFTTAKYWELKFSIRHDGIPKQFEDVSLRDKVYYTGVYLNILKECDIIFNDYDESHFLTSLSNVNLLNLEIDYWYNRANVFIMDLFIHGYDFANILNDFKDIFFMNNFKFNHVFENNLKQSLTHKNLLSLNEFQKDFNYFSGQAHTIAASGELCLSESNFFDDLVKIIQVQPLNVKKILNEPNRNNQILQIIEEIRQEEQEQNGSNITSKKMKLTDLLLFNLNYSIDLPFPLDLILIDNEIEKFQNVFRCLLVDKVLVLSLEENFRKISEYKQYHRKDSNIHFKLSILNFKFLNLVNKLLFIDINLTKIIYNKYIATFSEEKDFMKLKQDLSKMVTDIIFKIGLSDATYIENLKTFSGAILSFCKFSKKIIEEEENVENSMSENAEKRTKIDGNEKGEYFQKRYLKFLKDYKVCERFLLELDKINE